MKIFNASFLLTIGLAATCCKQPELPDVHAISGKYIKIADDTTAIGGDLDGDFHFVIIPDRMGQPMLAGQSVGGAGYLWNGWIRFPDRGQIGFEAKCDRTTKGGTIVIGTATFDLGKGEVFHLPDGSDPKQILGSTAGQRDDPANARRLAEMLGRHKGEQEAGG
jgi:hypothetical protein